MPVEETNVTDLEQPTIGAVRGIVRVPEPYDTEINRHLNRMRARLFGLIDLSLSGRQCDEAKAQVRKITADAFNDVRRTFNRSLL